MEGAGTAGSAPQGTEGHRIEAERKDERQQESQQQRQVIRWERFLPRRSLRVLLVENDDSTRHIVTALLRKCSYHVAAVADGLKAWDILKEKQYRFDLVLTEVEMPSLSGIGLLSKITSCEQSRNIPVIMMSCQDSVNVVFKCMLEGAVDFLLKPVRRNELRNLWQHVWRKHCSTVNGVESVSNNQRKSEGMSGNNAAIKRATCADNGSKSRESCDEGGDTQSSGSKPMTRELRMQKHGEPIATKLRNSSLEMDERLEKPNEGSVIPETASHKNDNRDEENELMRFRPETTPLVREVVLTEKHQGQGGFYDASACRDEHESYKEKSDGNLESHGSLEKLDVNLASPGSLSQGSVPSRPSKEINFIGSGANGDCSYASLDKNAHRDDFHCGVSRSPTDTNLATSDALSSWELSVRGPNLSGCSKEGFQGRLLLKPSAASAFSRYGTGVSISCQKSSSSPVSSCIANKNSSNHFQSNSGSSKEDAATIPSWRLKISQGNEAGTPICRQVSSASNEATDHLVACLREDVGVGHSSTKDNNHTMVFHPSLLGLMSLPFPMGGIPIQNLCAGYGSMLQPVFYSEPSQHNSTASGKAKDLASSDQLSPHGNRLINNISSQQNCHPYHLEQGGRNHTVDRATGDPRGSMCTEGEQSGPDDVCNQNFNSSGSNGSGGMTDGGVSAGMTTDGGSTSGFQNCNMKGLEWDRSRRETALIKFRLKRKDRCFEKKVRYHSRKKLAEQRPRVKGQFVRQFAT